MMSQYKVGDTIIYNHFSLTGGADVTFDIVGIKEGVNVYGVFVNTILLSPKYARREFDKYTCITVSSQMAKTMRARYTYLCDNIEGRAVLCYDDSLRPDIVFLDNCARKVGCADICDEEDRGGLQYL